MDWTRGHPIGHGSSAPVSLATSSKSGDVFAVKSTELSKSELLQREQKFLSSLDSPHIIGYRGCDITNEHNKLMYNLCMEYAPGGTLNDEIQRNGGRLGESLIACYTRKILLGLEYLHSNGLVHCDIKSRNILVTETGAKIADFGCAKWEAESVQSGGTPMFMAPEVARGEHQGFASDIWAVGCTVIEMASGATPWPNATDPVTVLYRIAYSCELPEFPGYLSKQAKDFLSNCLRRDPKERWTASQLLRHPFLGELNSCSKETLESNSSSISPTSILDQGIWNSAEETEESLGNLILSSSRISAWERIRRLSSSEGPSWDCDETWITIRGINNDQSDASMEDIEAKDDMICGSVLDCFSGGSNGQKGLVNSEKLLGCLGGDNSGIISRDHYYSEGLSRYRKDSIVILSDLNLQRDKDRLSFPLISSPLIS